MQIGMPLHYSAACPPLQAEVEARPLIFNSFMVHDANEAPLYAGAPSAEALKKALEEKLAEYNEGNAGGSSCCGEWLLLGWLLLQVALGSAGPARQGASRACLPAHPPAHPAVPRSLPAPPLLQSWTWSSSSRPWSTCAASPAS